MVSLNFSTNTFYAALPWTCQNLEIFFFFPGLGQLSLEGSFLLALVGFCSWVLLAWKKLLVNVVVSLRLSVQAWNSIVILWQGYVFLNVRNFSPFISLLNIFCWFNCFTLSSGYCSHLTRMQSSVLQAVYSLCKIKPITKIAFALRHNLLSTEYTELWFDDKDNFG